MATTDQELKTLNKTVNEAVNILKLYVGNSAQVKAMNEKEREAIDKWLNVVDLAEEREKRQRAFTERQRDEHGRFVKKQDAQANKFMKMAGAVKGLFGKAATGIKTSIGTMVSGITKHLTNFFQAMKSQFLSLFGEESEWFALLGTIKDSITGFMGSVISFMWQKTPNWAKKMLKYMQAQYALQVKQMKMDFMDAGGTKEKKVGIMGILSALVFAIGASIGAFMHRYFFMLMKLPIFAKIGRMFETLESIPFLGKLIKSIKFGFKWLGWPLTLILSLIDFIKGYQETEGTTWEKIKGGLWEAFKGLIEMPIRFLTWAAEKILGWFDVDFDGKAAADKMLDVVKKGFDAVLTGWEFIFQIVTGLFKTFWNGMINFVQSKIPAGLGGFLDKWKFEETATATPEPKRYSVRDAAGYNDYKKEVDKRKQQEQMNKEIAELKRATVQGNRAMGNSINNLANVQSQQSDNNPPQIADEVDNSITTLNNHNGSGL